MLDSCIVVVYTSDDSLRPILQRRFAALSRFYAPHGADPSSDAGLRYMAPGRVSFGQICFSGRSLGSASTLTWGEDLPAHLSSARDLVSASDLELRDLEGSLAVMAVDGDRGRLVSGAGCPTSLYSARGDRCAAWSTHALAAAWMASGRAELDGGALPELFALEFVAGDRTLVQGARAVPLGTRVDFNGSEPTETAYWSPQERWTKLSEEDAYPRTESALLGTLSRRLDGEKAGFLGLTGGVDSRVIASALVELGIGIRAFTWGEQGWPDVTGAHEVAATLGIPHQLQLPHYMESGAALRDLTRQVRWTEGALPVGFVRQTWPTEMSAYVTGTGGEAGRAFYYRRLAARNPEADTRLVSREFGELIANRLPGARREVRLAWTPPPR